MPAIKKDKRVEIILKQDLKTLGYKNDLVRVKPGYARNYLIPEGVAVLATPSNVKVMEESVRQVAHKAEKIKNDALEIANKISVAKLIIKAKVGESGRIFGAVTALQLADALAEKGIDIDRRRISFDSEVKSIGEYTASVDLHREVKSQIQFEVVAD